MTNRREYTAEFKLEAVKLVKETGQASTKIAKDLGIDGSMLSKKIWYRRRRSSIICSNVISYVSKICRKKKLEVRANKHF